MGITLFVLGLAGMAWGAMLLFNVRGTVDKAVARRNAVRAVTGARTLNMRLAEPSRLGPWFFRLTGGIIFVCSPSPVLAGLTIAMLE
ncbi:hypothetical protein [Streptomyces sp. NPDC058667]|uniref:hypothetical protein n=1 Tax=Streptomyces sp. NPDC058667 TaxID=3346588 RepID=UPI003650CD38